VLQNILDLIDSLTFLLHIGQRFSCVIEENISTNILRVIQNTLEKRQKNNKKTLLSSQTINIKTKIG